jgi:hypothetical protein
MSTHALSIAAAAALGAALLAPLATQGQDSALDRRVVAVADGQVQFHFASHAEVCGDGERWFRVGDDSWHGSWSSGDDRLRATCDRGPVRVTITKLAREIIRIETAAGPLKVGEGVTDLGAVSARAAAAWLFDLATRLDGRPARDAILPAVIADSTTPTPQLLRIAQDRDRARETRRSAIGWIARAPELSLAEGIRALRTLAADDRDAPAVRQSAIAALARLPRGAGIAPLTELAAEREDVWLGREAMRVIARSGDPRARAFLRSAVADAKLPEGLRAAAITGLGGDQATGADAKLLRDSWGSLEGERTKEALLAAVSSVGGAANAAWLLTVARDESQPIALRRRAVTLAERAGANGAQLAALYDAANVTDLRLTAIAALAQEGSKPSRDKLIAIARSTETATVRRRAVAALDRLGGEDAREALAALAVP